MTVKKQILILLLQTLIAIKIIQLIIKQIIIVLIIVKKREQMAQIHQILTIAGLILMQRVGMIVVNQQQTMIVQLRILRLHQLQEVINNV